MAWQTRPGSASGHFARPSIIASCWHTNKFAALLFVGFNFGQLKALLASAFVRARRALPDQIARRLRRLCCRRRRFRSARQQGDKPLASCSPVPLNSCRLAAAAAASPANVSRRTRQLQLVLGVTCGCVAACNDVRMFQISAGRRPRDTQTAAAARRVMTCNAANAHKRLNCRRRRIKCCRVRLICFARVTFSVQRRRPQQLEPPPGRN